MLFDGASVSISVPEKLFTILKITINQGRRRLTTHEGDGVLSSAHFPSSLHRRVFLSPFPSLISNEEIPKPCEGSSRRTWTRMGVHYISISPASLIVERRKLRRNKLAASAADNREHVLDSRNRWMETVQLHALNQESPPRTRVRLQLLALPKVWI
jgi:hypothetical protein